MSDEPYKCELCSLNTKEIIELDTRLSALEQTAIRLREGFLKNDLGLPDYDGHRRAHGVMVEQSQVVEGYKRSATKTILGWFTAGAIGMFSMGIIEWVKQHIK